MSHFLLDGEQTKKNRKYAGEAFGRSADYDLSLLFLAAILPRGEALFASPRDLSLWNRFPNTGELYLCELERETCKVEQTGTPTESADEGSSSD